MRLFRPVGTPVTTPCVKPPRFFRLAGVLAALTLTYATTATAQPTVSGCGSLANSFGPHDYRTERGQPLRLVEGAHFTPVVEALISGHRGYLGGDLDYTLRAFPNHHRALVSMMRYGERTKTPQPPNVRYPVECYFLRAVQFQPDDTTVRMLYATFLQKAGRGQVADEQLRLAEEYAKDNAFTHYNIGLVYLDGKNYESALRQAHRAYALGFPRTELKERLQAAGHWRDPAPHVAARAASAPSPAASESKP